MQSFLVNYSNILQTLSSILLKQLPLLVSLLKSHSLIKYSLCVPLKLNKNFPILESFSNSFHILHHSHIINNFQALIKHCKLGSLIDCYSSYFSTLITFLFTITFLPSLVIQMSFIVLLFSRLHLCLFFFSMHLPIYALLQSILPYHFSSSPSVYMSLEKRNNLTLQIH